ncbi:MAG: SDR family oxidoreductase [Bacteroidota bacterium]
MFSLEGKKILITGASSGIGAKIAIMAAEFGACVTLTGRSMEKLNIVRNHMKANEHDLFPMDLTNEESILQLSSSGHKFDGVVYNAGVIDYTPVKFINQAKFNKIFDINFTAIVLLNGLFIKNKRLNKNASLVFVSSVSSQLGVQGTALYAASKAALNAYARITASELAIQGIRSNSISPGIVKTGTHIGDDVTNLAVHESKYPLGYGTPEDIGHLVIYMLSNASRWMTGTDIKIDGGYSLHS